VRKRFGILHQSGVAVPIEGYRVAVIFQRLCGAVAAVSL
jgi:hypothetical protein